MLSLTIDLNPVQDTAEFKFGSHVFELKQRNTDAPLTSAELNDLLQCASVESFRKSSDRSSLVLQAPARDILQTIVPQLAPQKNTAKNRKVRRSHRLKIKRIEVVKRQRGFRAVKGADNATSHPGASSHQGEHRHHKRHHRHHKMPTDPMSGLPQATFNQISAEMLFGAPHDIAAGWDGTLSAIDPSGAHHLYDSIGDAWNPSDGGIDAIAFDSIHNVIYCFRESQYITIDLSNNNQTSAPTEIADHWTNLPYSFTSKVTGAAFQGGDLYLFNGGRYIGADGPTPLTNLTDWKDWPTHDPNFGSGVIDAVVTNGNNVWFLRNGNCMQVDLANQQIVGVPHPIVQWYNWSEVLPPDWVSSGFDSGIAINDTCYVFKGPAVVAYDVNANSPVAPVYIPTQAPFSNWPNTWHPQLVQAPSGRIGNLWSVDASNNVYHHDGTAWSVIGRWAATSISVGQDGTTVYLSPYTNVNDTWQTDVYQVVEGTSQHLTPFPGDAVQILVGNAEQIWVRDNHNNVYQYDLQQKIWNRVDLEVSPTATAVAADGTLWHNDNQGNAYRFLAGGSTKSVTGITNVQRLTTTGYGSVHCLVQQDGSAQQGNTQLYCYDSPYVFKSSQGYPVSSGTSIVQGLGNLYMIINYKDEQHQQYSYIVAVDAHTGQEISRTEDLGSEDLDTEGNSAYYTGVVFDPIHELVYLTSYLNSTQSVVTAVDARNLTNKIWHFAASIIDTPPALSGTQLCFGDRSGTLYLFNTSVALQTANQSEDSNPNLQPQNCGGWQQAIPEICPGLQAPMRLSTPVFAPNPYGQINVIAAASYVGQNGQSAYSMVLVQCDVHNPSNMKARVFESTTVNAVPEELPVPFSPIVLGQALFKDNSTQPALLLVSLFSNAVFALPFTLSRKDNLQENLLSFKLAHGKYVQTGIGYDSNSELGSSNASVWFADSSGTLWGLNSQLKVVNQYHATGDDPDAQISTTPFIYNTTVPDSQNTGKTVTKPVVIFGITSINTDFDWNSLFLYEPDSSNQFSIDTGSTEISALSTSLNNGVIYAGGNIAKFTPSSVWFQVFGIRVDELIQGFRDFIIESQLMQDPDDSATNGSTDPNNPIPPSVARYQTHLTIVDDLKAPRPYEAVKIWADQPNTQVIINDQPYTIGPDDNPTPLGQSPLPGQTGYSYASVKTGVDGTLVIVSTAGNVNTSMLRVWTTFMDPYERILVFPDHEFHGRVSNSYASSSSSTSDDSYTDPDHPDLSSVGNYSGTSLFTDADKSAGQPQQVAKATQQMRQGVDPGASTQVQLGRVLSALRSADPNTPYVPYEDLSGMHYAPNNAIATRPAQINQAMGLKFALANPNDSYDPNNNPFSHTAMDHANARTAIDNLEGELWSPTEVGLPFEGRRVGNIFTDFWNFLVSAVDKLEAKIKQVIVSIAEDIYVGLQYVWNGIKKAFKAIIKVIEDIAHAIASFFLALAKLIMDIIEALSVLFHFGEILWTQRWLEKYLVTQLLDLKQTVKETVLPEVDKWFQQGKDAIKQAFSQATAQAPQSPISQQQGAGTSNHTAYTFGQKGSNTKSSRSVQCSHTTQKLKTGAPSSSIKNSSLVNNVADDNPVTQFVEGFVDLVTNGSLSDDFSNFKSSFEKLFQSTSVSSFFDNALDTFLGLIEGLIEMMIDVAHAFVGSTNNGTPQGLLGIFDSVIDWLIGPDGQSGLLTQTIEIPFISWLYKELTGEDLTILNLFTLVIAIPVTIIFRVVEGKYPSQAGLPDSLVEMQVGQAEALAPILQRMLGFCNFMATIVAAVLSAVSDADPEGNGIPPLVPVAIGIVLIPLSLPLISGDAPKANDWTSFGIGAAIGLLPLFGLVSFKNKANQTISNVVQSLMLCTCSITSLAFSSIVFHQLGSPGGWDGVVFSSAVFSITPGIVNPIKLVPGEVTNFVVAGFDGVCGIIAAVLNLIDVIGTTDEQTAEGLYSIS